MKVTAVFDIGRTNKKCALFDEKNNIVEEFSDVLPETVDDDGFPCEDIALLTEWVKKHWADLRKNEKYQIKAVNVSAYGASLVHLDAHDQIVTPLYSYLKPVPKALSERFYSTYGDPVRIALQTASPVLGMLNSGVQLYWLKYSKPTVYERIKTSLHLPQYISFLLTGRKVSDFTSIGCHTGLWSYEMMDYHEWVKEEGFHRVLAPMLAASSTLIHDGPTVIQSGFGLHDSSSALIPYRMAFKEPFILLSTGTWCINLNPFQSRPLTGDQLSRDCLHFMTPEGSGVKASRVFLGQEHEHQAARIAEYFHVAPDFYKTVEFNPTYLVADTPPFYPARMKGTGPFPDSPQETWQVSAFASAEAAYHHLLVGLIEIEAASLQLIGVDEVPTLFVDGGFARNDIFTQLLARRFPKHQVYTAELPYASALGAALHVTRPQGFEFPGTIRQVIPQ